MTSYSDHCRLNRHPPYDGLVNAELAAVNGFRQCHPPIRPVTQLLRNRPDAGPGECGGKPLRIIGADLADIASLEAKFDRVERGDVIEAPAWTPPDSKTVRPSVAHDADAFDIRERNAIIPKP
jgi:hypothetical protein